MRKKTFIITMLIVFVTSCWRCSNDSNVEKHQNNRSNVIHVKDKNKEIDLGFRRHFGGSVFKIIHHK